MIEKKERLRAKLPTSVIFKGDLPLTVPFVRRCFPLGQRRKSAGQTMAWRGRDFGTKLPRHSRDVSCVKNGKYPSKSTLGISFALKFLWVSIRKFQFTRSSPSLVQSTRVFLACSMAFFALSTSDFNCPPPGGLNANLPLRPLFHERFQPPFPSSPLLSGSGGGRQKLGRHGAESWTYKRVKT